MAITALCRQEILGILRQWAVTGAWWVGKLWRAVGDMQGSPGEDKELSGQLWPLPLEMEGIKPSWGSHSWERKQQPGAVAGAQAGL